MMEKKTLSVGAEFFDDLIQKDHYYVDKTSAIADLLKRGDRVTLFTRPRRFGKTLFMTTLKSFFEIGTDPELFSGLAIAKEQALCERYLGRHPVIFLTLKGVEGISYEVARGHMIKIVSMAAEKHDYLRNSEKLNDVDKKKYASLLLGVDESGNWITGEVLVWSLRTLSDLLAKHWGTKAVILIDEYDVPLDCAYRNGYYEEMVDLIRGMFGNALKTSESLELAVLTGCLRIAKESIFTGLNNFTVWTMAHDEFSDAFGFTDGEVQEMLAYYDRSELYDSTREWYDGYRFGNRQIFCPWDVVNYVSANCGAFRSVPENYWTNTSGNTLLMKFIEDTSMKEPEEIEELLAGGSIEVEVTQELTYRELTGSRNNLWSVLYMTGYLTVNRMPEEGRYSLVIPNREIRHLFVTKVKTVFDDAVTRTPENNSQLARAFVDGKTEEAEKLFTEYLREHISIRDTNVKREMKENFYHGYLLGILQNAEKNGRSYLVRSNREGGDGYADIMLKERYGAVGVLIEVKYAEDKRLDFWAEKALAQIDEKRYEEIFEEDEVKKVLKYGVACYRKRCRVMKE